MCIAHIKTINILFLSLVLILGCNSASHDSMHRQFTDDGILKFNTKQLSKGEVLKITLPLPHPKELAIKSPTGQWFYLHIEDEGENNKLMPSLEFTNITKLNLNTATLQAIFWKNGKAIKENVFTTTGDYLIYMADNMETEPENTLHFASIINYTN